MTVFLDVCGDVVECRVGSTLSSERFRVYLAACFEAGARFKRQPPRHVLPRAVYIAFRDRLSAAGIESVTTHNDTVKTACQHNYITPENCGHQPPEERCHVCDGGLSVCRVCGGAEGTLTTECSGKRLPTGYDDLVYAGRVDFVGGEWRKKDLLCHCGTPESQHGPGDNHQFRHAGKSEHDFADAYRAREEQRNAESTEATLAVEAGVEGTVEHARRVASWRDFAGAEAEKKSGGATGASPTSGGAPGPSEAPSGTKAAEVAAEINTRDTTGQTQPPLPPHRPCARCKRLSDDLVRTTVVRQMSAKCAIGAEVELCPECRGDDPGPELETKKERKARIAADKATERRYVEKGPDGEPR